MKLKTCTLYRLKNEPELRGKIEYRDVGMRMRMGLTPCLVPSKRVEWKSQFTNGLIVHEDDVEPVGGCLHA